MPRRKRLSPDAEQVAVYLTPAEQLVLQTVRARKKSRDEERTSTSEVIADALWAYLEDVEGISHEEISNLLRKPPRRFPTRIKVLPKTGRA